MCCLKAWWHKHPFLGDSFKSQAEGFFPWRIYVHIFHSGIRKIIFVVFKHVNTYDYQ